MATGSSRGWELASRLWIMGTPKLADVEALGITAIVRVARPPVDPAVVAAVRHFIRWPLPDGRQVDVDAVMRAARSTAQFWRDGHAVLVCCVAGRNRSALVAAVALTQLGLEPPDQVIAHVRARRPRALANPSAEAWLTRWLTLQEDS